MECPNCHDANKYGDYEGPTCEVCHGAGSVPDAQLLRRAAAFINDRDPFGDFFSANDLALLDPAGGFIER